MQPVGMLYYKYLPKYTYDSMCIYFVYIKHNFIQYRELDYRIWLRYHFFVIQ